MNSTQLFSNVLARAEEPDYSANQWIVIFVAVGVIVAIAALVAVPILVARRRRLRRVEAIQAFALLWGAIAAVSCITTAVAEFHWRQEYQLRIKTGYYDPQDLSGAPTRPVPLWVLLGTVYVVVLLSSLIGKKRPG